MCVDKQIDHVHCVQCFWRVSEVVSEQSVEGLDCRMFLVSRTSWRSGLGNRISGSSRSSREILFGLTGGLSEVSVTVLPSEQESGMHVYVVTLRVLLILYQCFGIALVDGAA